MGWFKPWNSINFSGTITRYSLQFAARYCPHDLRGEVAKAVLLPLCQNGRIPRLSSKITGTCAINLEWQNKTMVANLPFPLDLCCYSAIIANNAITCISTTLAIMLKWHNRISVSNMPFNKIKPVLLKCHYENSRAAKMVLSRNCYNVYDSCNYIKTGPNRVKMIH